MNLYDSKGNYLGKLTSNKFDSDSIFNESGTYGGKFSSTSIWNEFSDYGSEFYSKSSFNEFATYPPKIYAGDTFIGYLSVSTTLSPRISPYGLKKLLQDNGY